MERQIAALFGKPLGLMCNSGSSALYLAIELLDLPVGSEVITSPLTFSTDIAPIVIVSVLLPLLQAYVALKRQAATSRPTRTRPQRPRAVRSPRPKGAQW